MVSSDMLWYSTITLRNRHLTGGFIEPPTSFEGQQLYSVCSELRVPWCWKNTTPWKLNSWPLKIYYPKRKGLSSNHRFSGAMLNLRGVMLLTDQQRMSLRFVSFWWFLNNDFTSLKQDGPISKTGNMLTFNLRHSGGIHGGCLITNAGMLRRLHDCLMPLWWALHNGLIISLQRKLGRVRLTSHWNSWPMFEKYTNVVMVLMVMLIMFFVGKSL